MGTVGRRRTTLTDVAGRAGVSASTASYVLNGLSAQMRIASDTEQRVRRVAQELGYQPNRSARSLRTRRTATLGLVCDFVSGAESAALMLSGASGAARDAEHLLLIGESEGDADVESGLIEEMVARQVDGIVYATLATSDVRLPLALRHHRVVLLNCVDRTAPVPAVLADAETGGADAAGVLVEAGLVSGVHYVGEPSAAGAARLTGLQRALVAAGGRPAEVLPSREDIGGARGAVGRWLDAGARPAALLCSDDQVAIGACHALADAGLRVPADVSVLSFEGGLLAGAVRPALTSLAMPYAEMGALAVRRLLEDAPERPAPGTVTVPMTVVPGGSVGGPGPGFDPSTGGESGPMV